MDSTLDLRLDSIEEPLEGALIRGRFRLTKRIAESHNHLLFRSIDETVEAEVVLKFLNKRAHSDPVKRARLDREGRLLHRVKACREIVVLQANESRQAWPFLVLEYIDGETLTERCRRLGRLDIDDCVRIAFAVATALECMRQNQIVHRDIKPDNVLVGRDGSVRVIDLSVARDLKEDAPALTREGAFMGTPGYESPEQQRGEVVDWRSDAYSLGLLLYEMAVGSRFSATRGQPVAVARLSNAPRRLRRVLGMMLHEEKNRRSSLAEICRELERIAQPTRRRRHVVAVAALAAVLIAGGVGLGRAMQEPSTAMTAVANTSQQPRERVESTAPAPADIENFLRSRDEAVRIEGRQGVVVGLTDEELTRMFDAMERTRSRDLVSTIREFTPMMRRRIVNIATFYIQRYEVTWAQFALWLNTLSRAHLRYEDGGGLLRYVDDEHGFRILDGYGATEKDGCGVELRDGRWRAKDGCDLKPVEGISPAGAAALCRDWNMRLVTGDEWEYAARGNTNRWYPWGREKPECSRLAVDQVHLDPTDTEYFKRWLPACPLPRPSPRNVRAPTQDVTPEYRIYGLFGNVSEITLPSVPGLAPNVYEVHGTNYRSIVEIGLVSMRGTIRSNEIRAATGFRCASDRN